MTEIEIKTEKSYDDRYIEFVRICQENIDRTLKQGTYEDGILKVSESGSFEHDFGEVYLASGCKLDLEVVTPHPEPHISVEVSYDDVGNNSSGYAGWSFKGPGSESAFEQWVDKNGIEVSKK
jgi:hypothetical protein